ncbi:hypothetical protein M9H77_36116 [Catharanthus roseus]|uniref:Uncharacterized protein n=1 Tax=Catharanthus roseus TaxID=4058 RepID=A0ACB9ZTG2_CATRO|nr:hypothetical protein M9H77_36116 [Catharanthus roseus]
MLDSFRGCTIDRESPRATSDLGLVANSCIASLAGFSCGTRPSGSTWCYHIRDDLVLPIEDLSSPDYIRWYRDIIRVYIGNPAYRDTRNIGYQPPVVDRRMMEIKYDVTTGVLEGPPSSLTQYASVMRKVQTIICRGALVDCQVAGPVEALHVQTDEDLQTPDMEEREMEDLGDGDVEIREPDLDAPTFIFGLTPLAQSRPNVQAHEPIDDAIPAKQLGFGHHIGMDSNLWRVRMTMRVSSFYEEYQMFNSTLYIMNNDDEIRYLCIIRPNISKEGIHEDDNDNDDADENYEVSSESDDENDDNDEEDDISTLINLLSSTIVNQ